MLSKSLLEWPKEASAQPVSNREVTSVVTEKPGGLLDAQARALEGPDSFEARWRERVKMQ
jgi:tripartite-type tricarboxylate transporter receptor subunit TctC